jgi:hypothetical protein
MENTTMTNPTAFNSVSTPAGIGTATALAETVEARRLCALGYHAWVPWLAVNYPPDARGGAVSFYETWCARDGCDHHEQWDCP